MIPGLDLERLELSEIVVTEGDSRFVIASGAVRAWIRTGSVRGVEVRTLGEDDFFGEISLLTGEVCSAAATTSSACERGLSWTRRATRGSCLESPVPARYNPHR